VPLTQSSPSSIGTVYLTDDATISGAWTWVEWSDWASRGKKAKATDFALDGTPHVTTTGVGVKGFITLEIPSCPAALYTALETLANTTTHYTATLYHAQKGTVTREVEVLSISAPADEQWEAGDPVENVTVRCVAYGTGS
jgi:hypothetical protein